MRITICERFISQSYKYNLQIFLWIRFKYFIKKMGANFASLPFFPITQSQALSSLPLLSE